MNHQIPPYSQNVPILNHTDWATMAKQWATLRANVNIPTSINKVENFTYQHIPPPPPPPPSSLSAPKPALLSYNNDYKPVVNHDPRFQFNRNAQNLHINNNVYEPPMHSMYNEIMPSNINSHCETFDYNHRDRPFVNFNNNNPTFNRPSASASSFSQNVFNLPPPTHQDYIEPQPIKPTFLPDPVPPKLFPIDVKSQPLLSTPVMPIKEQPLPYMVNKFDHQSDFSTTRTTKGLPAWIIDDMKKIKEKEKKVPIASMGDYRDNHLVNSKRDEEGDIVMEDDNKEPEIDPILSGKSVITTNRIDNLNTDIDIDDVNLNDEDDGFDKIDYSSKSLIDLIEMLDETELDNLKIVIIRDSLTGVMKEVTDDMITEVVSTTFSSELTEIHIKSKMKGVSRDSKTVNCISDATVKAIDSPVMEFQNENTCRLLALIIIGALLQWGGDSLKSTIIPGITSLASGAGNRTISMSDIGKILSDYVTVLGNAGLIIFIIGIILFVICICGSCGVCCKNRLLMIIYLALTLAIWVLIVIFIIVFFTKRSDLNSQGNSTYTQLLQSQYEFNNGSKTQSSGLDVSGIIDLIQAKFQCCGASSYMDFAANPGYNKSFGIIPFSCCIMTGQTFAPNDLNCTYYPTTKNSYYNIGCYSKLWTIIDSYSTYAAYGLIGLGIILLILIIIAGVLQKSYRDKEK